MPLRPCLGIDGQPCGALSPNRRCPTHTRAHEYQRTAAKRQRRPRASETETRRRAQAVADWLGMYGPWCPGYRRAPHAVRPDDLTADHVHPIGAGGREDGPLTVLCRPCNSRRGARTN